MDIYIYIHTNTYGVDDSHENLEIGKTSKWKLNKKSYESSVFKLYSTIISYFTVKFINFYVIYIFAIETYNDFCIYLNFKINYFIIRIL